MRCSAGTAEEIPPAQLLEVALEAARAGGKVVLDAADKPRNIEFKGTTDLVTETDKLSEDAVTNILRQRFPEHALLGEEGGVSGEPCDVLDEESGVPGEPGARLMSHWERREQFRWPWCPC